MKTIYDLKLHERFRNISKLEIIRVPGGWIYMSVADPDGEWQSTFVPFHNEFQE